MDYKLKNLHDKIYSSFVRGEYGVPKIPTRNEVLTKLLEITTLDPTPITNNTKMTDIDITAISNQFNNVIDDIDILFSSVEDESVEILEQLTNSLKEHSGVKRELGRIDARADDISAGKLGEDYLKYTFTETFNNLKNIDTFKSDQVDLEGKFFSIKRNSSRVLSLDHYHGSKLEFSVVQNFARLEEHGYVGTSDAGVLLDPNDNRTLMYRVKTNTFTPLKLATSLQLTPTNDFIEVNGVTLDMDSKSNKGQVRLYYRGKDAAWHDVTPISIIDIQGDRVMFNFDSVSTTHLKVEFIKSGPDLPTSLEYLIILKAISIYKSTSVLSSTLQSKPIVVESYSKEHAVVDSLKAFIDMDIPEGTNSELFIAKDVVISGAFKDSNGNVVDPTSPNISVFDSSYDDTVFLSQLKDATDTISGVAIYKGLDYNWLELEDYKSVGGAKSKVVGFNLSSPIETMDNTLYSETPALYFGDSNYLGPWPVGGGDWYYSGWCNTSNSWWDPYLSGMVGSGIFVSGVDVATIVEVDYTGIEDQYGNLNPLITGSALYSGQWLGYGSGVGLGYAVGYTDPTTSGTIKFGEINSSLNGWWRPVVNGITFSGLREGYKDDDGALLDAHLPSNPDFYFNGINFWKIYKFGTTEKVIVPSVKVYTYQERPIFGTNGYYPHSFLWKYKNGWDIKTGTALEKGPSDNPGATTFVDYNIDISGLFSADEEFIFDGISEIKVHNTNVVLNREDYTLHPTSSIPSGIELTRLASNRQELTPVGTSFDIKYSYKAKNKYLSTWTSYAIVSSSASAPTITIPNVQTYNKENSPIIKKINIENLDTGQVNTMEATDDLFVLKLSVDTKTNTHYKITIYCASDETTGFCAKYNSVFNWVPHKSRDKSISVSPGIKLVSNLSPLTIVDMGSLVYDSSIYNSRKAALYSTLDDKKFIVVKHPSKDVFPGYYFNFIKKQYEVYTPSRIKNKGHWVRTGYTVDNSDTFMYTTGSSGVPGEIYNTHYHASGEVKDNTWNEGSVLPKYPNSSGGLFYPTHTTYGYPINIDVESTIRFNEVLKAGDIDPRAPTTELGYVGNPDNLVWLSGNYLSSFNGWNTVNQYQVNTTIKNRGFLYYNTAENLSTYYSISYKVIETENDNNSRFLYKLILTSDNQSNLNPVVRSIKFVTNEN